MWFSSVRGWLNETGKSTSRGRLPTRPSLEVLEDRCVPAVAFVVNTLDDTVDLFPKVTSLREAIAAANNQAGDDIITFHPSLTGTIELTSALPDLNSTINIQGPGANVLTVARSRAVGTPNFAIFSVPISATVTLSSLTITNGNKGSGFGGGISNYGTLTLSNSTLFGNSAFTGGGIYNKGTLTLSNSTLFGNTALFGGGIRNDGTLTLSNSTLSDNTADSNGGGLFTMDATTFLTNATLTANRVISNNGTGGGGVTHFGGTLTLHNTLIAGNFRGPGTDRDDVFGTVATASSFNLIGDGTNLIGITNGSNGNLIGSAAAPIDPRLGPLQDNGGPTFTHALLSGSPAINRGLAPIALAADQRGGFRSGAPDIGAFEFIPPPVAPARSIVVVLVNKRVRRTRRLFVRVSFADNGALKSEVRSPYQKSAFRRILVAVFDSDGDGIADSVRLTGRKGKKTMTRLVAL